MHAQFCYCIGIRGDFLRPCRSDATYEAQSHLQLMQLFLIEQTPDPPFFACLKMELVHFFYLFNTYFSTYSNHCSLHCLKCALNDDFIKKIPFSVRRKLFKR